MIAALLLAAAVAPDAPVDVVEHLGEPIAEAIFLDDEGNRVRLRQMAARGKPVVLTLIYFDCPMLCSLVQRGVIKALNETGLRLGVDYYGLTVSFSPKDTVPQARLRQGGYLQTLQSAQYARTADWPYLTGGARSPIPSASAIAGTHRSNCSSIRRSA